MKKTISFATKVIAASMLILVASCGKDNTSTAKDAKNIKVFTWAKSNVVNEDDVLKVVSSEDGNVYALGNGDTKIYHLGDNGWTNTGFETNKTFPNAAGNLDWSGDAEVDQLISTLIPTANGVIAVGTKGNNGIALYWEGGTRTAGWINNDTDDYFANLTQEKSISVTVAKNAGEFLAVVDRDTGLGTFGALASAKIGHVLQKTSGGPAAIGLINGGAMLGDDFYLVSDDGFRKIAQAKIVDNDVSAPDHAIADTGAANWQIGGAGAPNGAVAAVYSDGVNIYLGFTTSGANEGGVAIFDGTAIKAPSGDTTNGWGNTGVFAFVEHDGKVWAVTTNDLIEVKVDGTNVVKGDKFSDLTKVKAVKEYDKAKGGYAGEDFAAALTGGTGIQGATSVGNVLYVATDDGLWTLTTKSEKIEKK